MAIASVDVDNVIEIPSVTGFIAPPRTYKYVKVPIARSLEDLHLLRSASKITVPQFLLLRVLFPEDQTAESNRDIELLQQLNVVSKSAINQAKTVLAADRAFGYLLKLVGDNSFPGKDPAKSVGLLGPFLLVRRHLDPP